MARVVVLWVVHPILSYFVQTAEPRTGGGPKANDVWEYQTAHSAKHELQLSLVPQLPQSYHSPEDPMEGCT